MSQGYRDAWLFCGSTAIGSARSPTNIRTRPLGAMTESSIVSAYGSL